MTKRSKLYDRNYGLGGRRGAAVRKMRCCAADSARHTCGGPMQACHARARGMGGVQGDARDLFPACAAAHREAGERGTSQRAAFEQLHGVDVTAIAERIAAELDEQLGPEPCWLCGQVEGHAPACKDVRASAERRSA